MNKFFYYYNSLCSGANTPSAFSFDPYIIAVKEMLVNELQQIVYYIEKLKKFNLDMSEYRDKVIDFISILIVNLDFKKENFFTIVEDLYNNKKKLEEMYISQCKEQNYEPQLIAKEKIELNNKESIIKALNEPLKTNYENNKLSKETKILYELIINIVLNACNCLIELKNLGIDFAEGKDEVLKLLNSSNEPNFENLKQKINDFSACNYKIVKLLNSSVIEKFGPVEKTQVNLAEKKGKAILVSGTSFLDLERILKAVKGSNINIYTHNEMLSAHEYKKLKSYKNLKGHYQFAYGNFSLEFAQFPGPIFISQNSLPKIDLIRGQIYTSVRYPSFGISKIENNDFSPLINYALQSKGFTKDEQENFAQIGFSFDDIENKLSDIINKFNDNSIKHIFIIGIIDMFNIRNEYISKFIKECPDDAFIISFGYNSQKNNFWHVNSFYDFSILYDIIEKLIENITNYKNNISVFLSECNSSTISHIFNIKYLGIKNIFLGPCCPNLINPSVIEGMSDIFNIQILDNPKKDIMKALKKEEE